MTPWFICCILYILGCVESGGDWSVNRRFHRRDDWPLVWTLCVVLWPLSTILWILYGAFWSEP